MAVISFLLSIFLVCVISHCFCTSVVDREVQSYSKDCHGNACNYSLQVTTGDVNHTGKLSEDVLVYEMSRLKVLLVDLSRAIAHDTALTAASIHDLTGNMTSLQHQFGRLLMVVNHTVFKQVEIQEELASVRSQLDHVQRKLGSMSVTGQPIIVRPAEPELDFPRAVGTDCAALYKAGVNVSGVYTLQPDPGNDTLTFDAFCDLEHDGGGWTVIQRRVDGSDDFFRAWQSYKLGFGGLLHDFWLGLDNIHLLTKFGNHRMRITLTDWDGKVRWSEFSYVRVANELDGYRIMVAGYRGNAGDPFHTTNYNDRMQSMRFSTYDVDNDMDRHGNCATSFTSGWWFNKCFLVNLNGVWYGSGAYVGRTSNGIVWDMWDEHPHGYSLKSTEIKLRPEHF